MFMSPLAIKALGIFLVWGALFLWMKVHDHRIFKQGEASTQAKWDKDTAIRKSAETNAILAAVETNRLLQKSNDAKTKKESDDYQIRRNVLRKNSTIDRAAIVASGGLRDPGIRDPITSGSDAEIQRGCDGSIAGTGQLSKESEEFLLTEAERADQIVEQARALQNEAKAHGLY